MRFLIYLVLLSAIFSGCDQTEKNHNGDVAQLQVEQDVYKNFGEKISASDAIAAAEMYNKFQALKSGDTIAAKFYAKVGSVCKMKGCWMTLIIPSGKETVMVKFKDYGFFVPKNIENKEVVVEGLAFIEETSVEDQKHYAEDAGQSKQVINAIEEVEKTFAFQARGVLLKQ